MPDLAILFADVAGSTSIYQRHGDRAALQWIEGALAAMKHVTQCNQGRVVKTIGDELMAVFETADAAFRAACEIQWQVDELAPLGSDYMAVRIGFHHGPALERDGDVFGDSVNIAARLVGMAKGGQIITSGRTLDCVDRQLAQHTRKLDRVALKGMRVEETIFEALWNEDEDVTTMLSTSLTMLAPTHSLLALTYEGVAIGMGPERMRLTLGRDEANDVVIVSRRASRVHARIEWRRDKFVLVDQSTNGTYVQSDNGADVFLRMEELALTGSGVIAFGHPIAKAGTEVMRFCCESATEKAAALSTATA
jgi:adenylate cyclase